jgi:glycosyltransferase involved in cell wall biosynthesis
MLIDARVNAFPGAHGIARSVMKLVAHMSEPADGLALRILVNDRREQIFSLSELPAYADVIGTDITAGAVHRWRQLARLIRSAGPAVLYIPYSPFTPVIRPCPFVVTIHDCTLESDAGFAGGWARQAGVRLVTRMALQRAAAATAPSRASLDELLKHYPAAPRPTLVPNGVDIRQFRHVPAAALAAARKRYQLPETFVLSIGAHRPHKNHGILVRAMAAIPGRVSLVIVGSPDPRFADPLPRLIADLGLESRVKLVPEVAEECLPAVYRASSVFAFPSLSEGFGMPVLEAMAAGVPVVMSEIRALAEIAGPAAMMIPPHDVREWASALTAVIGDAALASRLVSAGAAVAAEASWERGASALGSLLSAVAAGNPARSC